MTAIDQVESCPKQTTVPPSLDELSRTVRRDPHHALRQLDAALHPTSDPSWLRRVARQLDRWSTWLPAALREHGEGLRALTLTWAGEHDKALPIAERLTELRPPVVPAWSALVHSARSLGRLDAVRRRIPRLRRWTEVLRRGPDAARLAQILVEALDTVEMGGMARRRALSLVAERCEDGQDKARLQALELLATDATREERWRDAYRHRAERLAATEHAIAELSLHRDRLLELPHLAEPSGLAWLDQLGHQQEALAIQKSEADRHEQRMTRDLARLSHEIRTPLHGIVGGAELLLRTSLSEDQRELAEVLHASSELAIGVVCSVFTPEDDACPAPRCELASVVRDALLVVRHRAAERNLHVVGRVKAGAPRTLAVEPVRIMQVLTNLLGNAVKFTHSGSIGIEVSAVDDHVCLEVWDTGPGIPDEQIPDLFTRYARGNHRSGVAGSGLGLAITRDLVEDLRGAIDVVSVPTQGSNFRVYLPHDDVQRFQQDVDLLSLRPRSVAADADTDAPARGRVLIAEDDVVNRTVIERMTRAIGYDTVVVEDGRQAVDAVGQGDFDAVLMDCQMPELDGWRAAAALRAGGFRGRIIAFTAEQNDDDRWSRVGMDKLLLKPARIAELDAALSGCRAGTAP